MPANIPPDAITLKLRYGLHTIFLFVSPTSHFSTLRADLLRVLRSNAPSGLTTRLNRYAEGEFDLPAADADTVLFFGVPKNKNDLNQGFREINTEGDPTLAERGLKDMDTVAFAWGDETKERGGEGWMPGFDVVLNRGAGVAYTEGS